jgi:hypothetical protein
MFLREQHVLQVQEFYDVSIISATSYPMVITVIPDAVTTTSIQPFPPFPPLQALQPCEPLKTTSSIIAAMAAFPGVLFIKITLCQKALMAWGREQNGRAEIEMRSEFILTKTFQ